MRRAAPAGDDRHEKRSGEEHRRQDGGRARERVRLTAPGHEAAGSSARPKRPALGALQEDDRDEGDDDENVNDDQDGLHEEVSVGRPADLEGGAREDGALLSRRKGAVHRNGS